MDWRICSFSAAEILPTASLALRFVHECESVSMVRPEGVLSLCIASAPFRWTTIWGCTINKCGRLTWVPVWPPVVIFSLNKNRFPSRNRLRHPTHLSVAQLNLHELLHSFESIGWPTKYFLWHRQLWPLAALAAAVHHRKIEYIRISKRTSGASSHHFFYLPQPPPLSLIYFIAFNSMMWMALCALVSLTLCIYLVGFRDLFIYLDLIYIGSESSHFDFWCVSNLRFTASEFIHSFPFVAVCVAMVASEHVTWLRSIHSRSVIQRMAIELTENVIRSNVAQYWIFNAAIQRVIKEKRRRICSRYSTASKWRELRIACCISRAWRSDEDVYPIYKKCEGKNMYILLMPNCVA